MKLIFRSGLFLCFLLLRPAFAQQGATYPDVSSLRTTLLALAAEQKNGFQNIKTTPLNKKGTVQYYNSSYHIVKADTPKVCEDSDPLQVYYMDFLAKGLTVEQSKEAFKKWQDLISQALPGCTITPDGTQYPDLESRNVVAPDGVRFTLYRNGTGNACQVSLTFMHKIDANSPLLHGGYKDIKVSSAKSADAEGVHIDGAEYTRQLNQLLAYSKDGFKDIKGPKAKSEYVDKYATTFKMNGAVSQEIIDFPFLGISYNAVYMEQVIGNRGNALFEQLRTITGQSLPAGFKDEGVKDDGRMKTATYSANNQTRFVEITRSLITHTVIVSVRDRKKY